MNQKTASSVLQEMIGIEVGVRDLVRRIFPTAAVNCFVLDYAFGITVKTVIQFKNADWVDTCQYSAIDLKVISIARDIVYRISGKLMESKTPPDYQPIRSLKMSELPPWICPDPYPMDRHVMNWAGLGQDFRFKYQYRYSYQ